MKSAAAAVSPKSQLVAMSGTVTAVKVAQSQVARYVAGFIKGGEAAHDFGMSIIATAVLEAYKGNARNITEASQYVAGKSKKARAMASGFAALATMGVLDINAAQRTALDIAYKGKLDDGANKAIKDRIHGLAAHAAAEFEIAFLLVLNAPAEPKAKAMPAQAAAAVAEAQASIAADSVPATSTPAGMGLETAVQTVFADAAQLDQSQCDALRNAIESAPSYVAPVAPAAVELDVGALVEAVADGVKQGMLDSDDITLLRAALAAYDAANSPERVGSDVALSDLLTRSPALLSAQAH